MIFKASTYGHLSHPARTLNVTRRVSTMKALYSRSSVLKLFTARDF